MWGRLPLAGLLLAGCAFDPGGSSSSGSDRDASTGLPDARPGADGAAGAPDGPIAPDAGPVEPVLLETLTIEATSTTSVHSTVVLAAGQNYRLVASGVVDIRDGDYSGDADYWWANDLPDLIGDSVSGVDIGLAVNDTDGTDSRSPDWGEFAGSHSYQATIPGTDTALSAIFFDPNHGNNSGSLTLEIWGPP